MERFEEYQEAIKNRLASACLERADDGTCAPPDGRRCALDLNMLEIIKAVKAVKSDYMGDYAEQIRETVCEQCVNQDEHGHCQFRESIECCLDNFMLLVVDAIDDVDARHQEEVEKTV